MPDPSPRDFDDFDPDLRSLLEDLIEEFESALRSGEDLSPASLIAHVDDLDAKAWLLAELREIHGRWAADRAKDGVRAFWEQLGGGRGIAADSDSTSDPDDEPDSGKDRLTRPRLDPPFEHWPAGFELIEILKPGGTAEVFVAWELDVRRRVVLKVPRQATRPARLDAGQIARVVKRFKREGRTLGRLGASGVRAIPQFHGFVWVGDGETRWPVLVMEYVRGESLSAILKARRPGFDEGLYAHLENFARDLDVIHDNGDNHLDIKPSNIHVDRDGSWTALDWGFGRKVSGGPPPTARRPTTISAGLAVTWLPSRCRAGQAGSRASRTSSPWA